MVYCVMSPTVAGRVRRSVERAAGHLEGVQLLAERRRKERRSGPERRTRRHLPRPASDRRRIVYPDGRRVAERRAAMVPVAPPPNLPRALRQHAGELSFREPLDVPGQFGDDVQAVRAILRFQAGERDFAELYGRWFDSLYTYLSVTLERGADPEAHVALALGEAVRQLPRIAPGPEQVRPWLFALAYDAACGESPSSASRAPNGHPPAATVRDDEDSLDWLSDHDLLLLVERRPARERHALVLRYFAGLTFNEIGEVMRITPDAALALHRSAVDSLDATLAAVTRAPRVRDRHPMGRLSRQTPVVQRRRRALLAV